MNRQQRRAEKAKNRRQKPTKQEVIMMTGIAMALASYLDETSDHDYAALSTSEAKPWSDETLDVLMNSDCVFLVNQTGTITFHQRGELPEKEQNLINDFFSQDDDRMARVVRIIEDFIRNKIAEEEGDHQDATTAFLASPLTSM